MLNIKIDSLVGQIVRQELVGKGRKDEGLYLNFDCRLGNYVGTKTYSQSRGLHLVYHVNPGSSYVTVFSGVTDSPFASIKDVSNWKHESSHDTCWRDIHVFSEIYFDMAQKINEARMSYGLEDIAPAAMHENNSFNGFDKAFSWVKVSVTRDKNDINNYRKVLELL